MVWLHDDKTYWDRIHDERKNYFGNCNLCVQIMHIGPFHNEPESLAIMDAFLEVNGYENDINEERLHHEIYMSDARKVAP